MYKLTKYGSIQRAEDGAIVPVDYANADYQAYLDWIHDGNAIEEPDPPAQAEVDVAQAQAAAEEAKAAAKSDDIVSFLTKHDSKAIEGWAREQFPTLTDDETKVIASLANAIGALYRG
jgi:hypothetical protein